MFTSARNFSLNYIKKLQTRKKYHDAAQKEIEENTEAQIRTNQTIFTELLKRALVTLPQKCREIFEMSKYDGLTYDEIAVYMGLSKKTAEQIKGNLILNAMNQQPIRY